MKVKGSTQYRSVVVPYRPMHKLMWQGIYVLTTLVFAVVCFVLGSMQNQSSNEAAMQELAHLRELVLEQKQTLDSMSSQVSNSQMSADVDKQALEDLRAELVTLNQEISSLQESNNFYRNLMEPKANRSGLTIGALKLVPNGKPRHYNYELVLQQLTVRHELLSGHVTVTVLGKEEGLEKAYALKELAAAVDQDTLKLKFRFYQTIEGELVLPEGFEPYRVDVIAEKTGSSPAVVEESFGWLVQNS